MAEKRDWTEIRRRNIELVMARLDTSNLPDVTVRQGAGEGLSVADLEHSLERAYDLAYAEGVMDKEIEVQHLLGRVPEAVLRVGDSLRIDHVNGSHLRGTLMPGGILSTPARAATLDQFGQEGWMITYIEPGKGSGEDQEDED